MNINIKKVINSKIVWCFLVLMGSMSLAMIYDSTIYAVPYTCPDGTVIDVAPGAATSERVTSCPTPPATSDSIKLPENSPGSDFCGGEGGNYVDKKSVRISLNIGCRGDGNAIFDMVTAVLRFLSVAVGIILIGSAIVAGIQFTTSADNPQAKEHAIKRLYGIASAFFVFIMIWAALNFLVPGGLF